MIIIVILLLMINFIAITVIFQKNLYFCVIYLAVSSLVAGILFVVFSAPDIALAEIVVGCALIPFVYVITINKQKEFLVLDEIMDEGSKALISSLDHFCRDEKLKLKLMCSGDHEDYELMNVFRKSNIDLIIKKTDAVYVLICKESSTIDERALRFIKERDVDLNISIVKVGEDVKED
jgi:uncharacterized MnhB-related membrane protein